MSQDYSIPNPDNNQKALILTILSSGIIASSFDNLKDPDTRSELED